MVPNATAAEQLAATVDPDAVPSPAVADAPAPPGYLLLEEIGRGGMGVVYKARQANLNRIVALKMILAGGHASEDARRRFLGEAEAIAKVKHPGIVQIFDYGTHAGLPYFSLEYCPGGSLARHLSGMPVSSVDAARMVAGIARAIQAAHDRSIVHRDLKPGNVLIAEDGSPRVADFGLAKGGDVGHTATGVIVGTPSYMAPEQARGDREVGPAADVYALGAVLYECLTGRPPFRAATSAETLLQVLRDEPAGVRRLNATVPADLETVCHKCLSKEPARRYSSAAALADDLDRWSEGRPILARPVGRLERLWRWARREPGTAALVGTVALLLVIGTVVAWGLAAWALGEKSRADRKASEALANARQAEEARHAGQCELVSRLLGQNYIAGANRILSAMAPGYRGAWETRCLTGMVRARSIELPDSEGNSVLALSWMPDGTRLATAAGWSVSLYDASAGTLLRRWKIEKVGANAAACSPDGRLVAGGWRNGSILVWDAESGEKAMTLGGHSSAVRGLAWSPDGNLIASGADDGRVRVWDAISGKLLQDREGHGDSVGSMAFSPGGERLASSGHDQTLKVWDTATGRELLDLKGHSDSVRGVAWSPDGLHLASAGGDKLVIIWDTRTGKETRTLRGHEDGVWCVSWSADGERIASAGWDETVRVWDATTGAEKLTLAGDDKYVESVAWSPDGRRIAAGGWGALRIWDTVPGRGAFTLRAGRYDISSIVPHPDGRRIATGTKESGVQVWSIADGGQPRRITPHGNPLSDLAWSRDGSRLAGHCGDRVKVWDAGTGTELRSLPGDGKPVRGLAFSPKGSRLARGMEKVLLAWDLEKDEPPLKCEGHTDNLVSVVWSPDGRGLASCGVDSRVISWDANTGEARLVLSGHIGIVHAVAWHPDCKRVASAGDDRTVRVWDTATGDVLFVLSAHPEAVKLVVFSPDGTRIASYGLDRTLRIWDTETGQEKLAIPGHPKAVNEMVWSRDGKRIILTFHDGTVRVHDAAGVAPVESKAYHSAEAGMAKSPFVVAFHLERLRRLEPLDPGTGRRLAVALRQCPDGPGKSSVRRRADEFETARRAVVLLPLGPVFP